MQTHLFSPGSRPGPPATASGPASAAATRVDLPARAHEAAQLLKAMANPDRLLLLCQLVDGERSVTELGALSGIAQPSLSQQLAVLRGERLVATRREGKNVIYRVSSPEALALLQTLHGLFCAEPAVAAPRRAAEDVAHTGARRLGREAS